MPDDVVSIALMGYLLISETVLGGLFVAGRPVVGVRFTCMACGDVGLQI